MTASPNMGLLNGSLSFSVKCSYSVIVYSVLLYNNSTEDADGKIHFSPHSIPLFCFYA